MCVNLRIESIKTRLRQFCALSVCKQTIWVLLSQIFELAWWYRYPLSIQVSPCLFFFLLNWVMPWVSSLSCVIYCISRRLEKLQASPAGVVVLVFMMTDIWLHGRFFLFVIPADLKHEIKQFGFVKMLRFRVWTEIGYKYFQVFFFSLVRIPTWKSVQSHLYSCSCSLAFFSQWMTLNTNGVVAWARSVFKHVKHLSMMVLFKVLSLNQLHCLGFEW